MWDRVYQFYQVRGAARLRDGRIVVANAGSQELRYYDAAGRVWVQEYGRPGEDSTHWAVYRPGGELAATVTLPAGLDVYQGGEDFVLGKTVEELGVESVQLFRLVARR